MTSFPRVFQIDITVHNELYRVENPWNPSQVSQKLKKFNQRLKVLIAIIYYSIYMTTNLVKNNR